MSTHRMFNVTGQVALQLLRLVAESIDVFPPLKAAAADALRIVELVEEFHLQKAHWKRFGAYVRDATSSIIQSLAEVDTSHEDAKRNLEGLRTVLEETARKIESERALGWHARLGRFLRDPDAIADMRRQIDDIIDLFLLSTTITTMIDVRKMFDAVLANGQTMSGIARDTSAVVAKAASISRKASLLGLNATLDKLRHVQGASWDTSSVCLENTRVDLVDNALAWIGRPIMSGEANQLGGAKILLLTAVAGAGKTTVAHTLARRCAADGRLASSFFFDRETEGRNTPVALFTTIAADLSRLDNRLAERITTAIEGDRSLLSAGVSRQFEELVLKPSQECPLVGPVVLVIDALDEAWHDNLLDILCNGASQLPSTFRIFLTSRMRPELDILCRKPHVRWIELDVTAQMNMEAMAEGLHAIQRAVQLRRQLSADCPTKFTPDLAKSLNNLAICLTDLDRHEESLSAIQEAVELRRRLSRDRPAAFIPDLAISLNNLSVRLSDLHRHDDALPVMQETVELYRQLVVDRPDKFVPDLAMSLSNLSRRLSNLERHEEALLVIQESVELRRHLATARPATFTSGLSHSLNNLSICLTALGRFEEALLAVQEAVELRRRLAAASPAAYTHNLKRSLRYLSAALSHLGRGAEARAVIQEIDDLQS